MLKKLLLATTIITTPITSYAHCQMPCGIYHDEMVYDQIDQYVETMVKCMAILNQSKFTTVKERNEFVRWVTLKENESNDTAELILTFFLQQKIKPGEPDTQKRLDSAHKLLFFIVGIKQNTDVDLVDQFAEEWEKFKLMFHVEGYECKIEALKQKKLKASQIQQELEHEHDDNHEHTH